jgi:hypothetical protein
MTTIVNRTLIVLFTAVLFLTTIKSIGGEAVSVDLDRLVATTINILVESQMNEAVDSDSDAIIKANIARLQASKVAAMGALLRYSSSTPDLSGRIKRSTILLRKKLNLAPQDVIEFAIPELQRESGNREELYAIVGSVPDPNGKWLDCRFSKEFLFSQRDNLYAPFVQHAYTIYPNKGILLFIETCVTNENRKVSLLGAAQNVTNHSQMDVFLGKKTIDNNTIKSVVADLNVLVQSKEWWIRYFVARFVFYGPVYRDKQLLATLNADDNLLVRELIRTSK